MQRQAPIISYMQEARSEGEVLALVAEPLGPTEAIERLVEEDEEL